jgi:uncharacterized protein (DUF488 family)
MSDSLELLTVGYGRWPAKVRGPRLVEALRRSGVELLVDVRHSPCASNVDPAHHYGPRDWHLQAGHAGIVALLHDAGIGYLWLVELGNPQKSVPGITVLRRHLSEPDAGWPVHRGLELLRRLVVDERKRCCLMCACEPYESCHRKVVAEAFRELCAPVVVGRAEVVSS